MEADPNFTIFCVAAERKSKELTLFRMESRFGKQKDKENEHCDFGSKPFIEIFGCSGFFGFSITSGKMVMSFDA